MNTDFIEKQINTKDEPKDSPYNPYLIGNNEKQTGQICDFLQDDKKLLLVNGFCGTGKTELLNYISQNLNENVLYIKYTCFETTILDDMLLSFFESFRNYALKGTISMPRIRVENFVQKINAYFNYVKNPIVVSLDSFQAILKENKKDILNFLNHISKLPNVKIIITSRVFDYSEFENIDYDRVSILAFSKDYFEKYLKSYDIKNFGPLSNELYKQTRGYYNYIKLSVNAMILRKYNLSKFLEAFSKSVMPFSEFIIKETLLMIDPVSLHLFRLLAVMRIPIHVNLLKSINMFDKERINFFIKYSLLEVDGESVYLKDYYREIIEQQIQNNVIIKLHKACVDSYETQLPLKPMERDLRLSRQTMRNEIDYHSLFIPKKPRIVTPPVPAADIAEEKEAEEIAIEHEETPKQQANEKEQKEAKEESKEDKLKKINFVFEDEAILDNIADSINNFVKETVENKEVALGSIKMNLIDIMNTAKKEEANYNYKHAILLYQSALTKKNDENFDKFLPVIYRKLANVYKHLSDWHHALEYLTKLQDYYLNVSNEEKVWEVQLDIANVYYETYKQDNAKYILDKLENEPRLPQELRIRANILLAKLPSDSKKAFEYYKNSLSLVSAQTDKAVLAELYYRLGESYNEQDDIKQALINYQKCARITKDNNYLSRAFANLGELYDELGKTDLAVKCYEKSISLDKTDKNYNGLYSSSRHLSEIYSSRDSAKSLEYLLKSGEYAKELNEAFYMADIDSEIANYYLLRKDYENAYKYLHQALEVARTSLSQDNAQKFVQKVQYLQKFIPQDKIGQYRVKYGQ